MILLIALLLAPGQVAPAPSQADLLENVVDSTFRVYAPDNGLSGTCFLVERPPQGNKPANFVLVTAAHVMEGISAAEGRVALRAQLPNGELARREVPFPCAPTTSLCSGVTKTWMLPRSRFLCQLVYMLKRIQWRRFSTILHPLAAPCV